MATLFSMPTVQMSFAKKSGTVKDGSGDSGLGGDKGGGNSEPVKAAPGGGGGPDGKGGCQACTFGPPTNPPPTTPSPPPEPPPQPTTPGHVTDDGCTDVGPNKCPTPPIPNPNDGGTYCPGDSSTHCFKDEKDYARALWENGIRKASDCAGFDDQSECQQAVKDFHCTFFANCNSGNGHTATVSTMTSGLSSVQMTNLSARIAQLQSLMSKPYGTECKSQIQTLLDVTQQALDAQNGFIANHLPTLQQGIPACFGSNAE